MSWEEHRRKALCLQDVRGEKPFTCRMWCATRHSEKRRYTREKSPLRAGCVKRHSFNVMRRYTQEKSLLPVGCGTRNLSVRNVMQRYTKSFACRKWDNSFWNIIRRYTQDKIPMPAGCATRYFEKSGEDTQRKKALCLQDVWRNILKHHEKIHTEEKPFASRMYQETFWNVTRRDTQEKSSLPAGCF